MASVNKIFLVGNVGKDPEIRSFQNGGRVANFSLATSESWKTKSGEKKEKTEWHRISVTSEPLVNLVEKYVRKGSRLFIAGKIEYREYEKDGEKRFSTDISVKPFGGEIMLLDSKPEQEKESPEKNDMLDDEIPFD